MRRDDDHSGPGGRVNQLRQPLPPVRQPSPDDLSILYLEGPLRAPVNGDLRHRVQTLLGRGERHIVLDVARVWTIDAAGVGELVRAYNMATASNGTLQILHATRFVREILERAALFDLLSAGRESDNV